MDRAASSTLRLLCLTVAFTMSEQRCSAQESIIPADKSQVLIAAVSINGHPGQCGIDPTGYFSTIDAAFANELGIERFNDQKTQRVELGTAVFQRYGELEITLFDKSTKLPTISGSSLRDLGGVFGHGVDCVLSNDILDKYFIDVSEAAVTNSEHVSRDFRIVDSKHFKWSPDGVPQLVVRLPILGCRDFLIGTGSNSFLSISDDFANHLIAANRAFKCDTKPGIDLSGKHDGIGIIVIKSVKILDAEFQNVPAIVGNFNSVGFPLLRRLGIALDFPNKQIWHKEVHDAGLSIFPINASGMGVAFASPTQLRVLRNRPNSAATIAHVEAGDEIVQLDGKQPADLSLFQVQQLLAQHGKTIRVVFDRNGQRLEKNLHLKRPFLYPPVWEATKDDSDEFEKFLEQDKGECAAKLK